VLDVVRVDRARVLGSGVVYTTQDLLGKIFDQRFIYSIKHLLSGHLRIGNVVVWIKLHDPISESSHLVDQLVLPLLE